MALLSILTDPHPLLRTIAQPVESVGPEIRRLLDDMVETMHAARGIGLAAPQVGQSWRCIVMDLGTPERPQVYRCINPRILKSRGKHTGEEGCLSVPGQRGRKTRAAQVEMSYLDEQGVARRINATGLLAICIQHEIDHLDGKLYTDPDITEP